VIARILHIMSMEEFQTEWAMGTGFLPVNIKSAQSQVYQDYLSKKPWLKVFLAQIPVAKHRPTIAGYSRLSESIGRAIESTLLGKDTPEKALQDAQDKLKMIWESE
jgi:multiple sugar transport system substrate-binding protein